MKTLVPLMTILAAVVAFSVSPAAADEIPLKITAHNLQCSLNQNGTAVNCTGKFSGLANTTTLVVVSAGFTCTNKAGNVVQGQSGGQQAFPTVQNGQITFDVTTGSVSDKCTHADGHQACFDTTATIQVFQNNQLVDTEVVPIAGTSPTCQP
jgi:hypothetical protein